MFWFIYDVCSYLCLHICLKGTADWELNHWLSGWGNQTCCKIIWHFQVNETKVFCPFSCMEWIAIKQVYTPNHSWNKKHWNKTFGGRPCGSQGRVHITVGVQACPPLSLPAFLSLTVSIKLNQSIKGQNRYLHTLHSMLCWESDSVGKSDFRTGNKLPNSWPCVSVNGDFV